MNVNLETIYVAGLFRMLNGLLVLSKQVLWLESLKSKSNTMDIAQNWFHIFFTFLWISKTEKKQTNFFFMFFMSFLKEYFTCKTFGMDTVWTWKSNHKNNWIIYTNNKLWRELTVHFKKKNEIYLPLEIGRQFLLMYWMSFCIWLFDLGKIWYLYCLRVVEHLQHFRPAQKKTLEHNSIELKCSGVLVFC